MLIKITDVVQRSQTTGAGEMIILLLERMIRTTSSRLNSCPDLINGMEGLSMLELFYL